MADERNPFRQVADAGTRNYVATGLVIGIVLGIVLDHLALGIIFGLIFGAAMQNHRTGRR